METSTKKASITLSLDNYILDEIRKAAKDSKQSVNSKINSILTNYAYFNRYSEQESCIVVPGKDIVSMVLDHIEGNKLIQEYKTIVLDTIPSDLLEKNIELTFENCIKYVFQGELMYGGSYQTFRYYKDNENHLCLEFKHVYETRWSSVIAPAYIQLLETVFGFQCVETLLLPDGLVIKLINKSV